MERPPSETFRPLRSRALVLVIAAVLLATGCGADERTEGEGASGPTDEERRIEARAEDGDLCSAVEAAQERLDQLDPVGAASTLRPWVEVLPEDDARDLEAHLLDLEASTHVADPAGHDVESERAGRRFAAHVAERCDLTYEWEGVQPFQ